MKLFAGIDGGQSATTAIVGDETGRILARGSAGAADEVGQDASSSKLRDALANALSDALQRASLPRDSRFEAIVAGVSGYEGRVYGQPVQLPSDRVGLVHDTVIAHAGALDGKPGVVVICGTGSVAYARNERGDDALSGGWGYLFGDEGSGFWLAKQLIIEAAQQNDAGEPFDAAGPMLTFFQQRSLRALVRAAYSGELSRAKIASFAPAILQLAESQNESADLLVREGAASLVHIVMHAMERTGMPSADVAFTGGLMQSRTYVEQIVQSMRAGLPGARHVEARYDAASGALLLAYRSADAAIAELKE